MKIDRDYRAFFDAELRQLGIDDYRFSMGGKHPRLELTFAGRAYSLAFAGTPSDRRSMKNFLADLRKILGLQGHKPVQEEALPASETLRDCRAQVAANPPTVATDKDRRALALLDDDSFRSATTIGRHARATHPERWGVERLERLVLLGLAETDGLGRYRRMKGV